MAVLYAQESNEDCTDFRTDEKFHKILKVVFEIKQISFFFNVQTNSLFFSLTCYEKKSDVPRNSKIIVEQVLRDGQKLSVNRYCGLIKQS